MDFLIVNNDSSRDIVIENQKCIDGVTYVDIVMKQDTAKVPESFYIKWKYPVVDCYSTWSPAIRCSRELGVNWLKQKTHSCLAQHMPLHTIVSSKGQNRLAIALSDGVSPVTIATGVCEEDACLDCQVQFFTSLVAPLEEYRVTLRLDTRDINYCDSIYDVVNWWENDCGLVPTHVPEHALLPMNSLWYTYHQELDVEDILKECHLSKALGMDTVIIDDGWQTDDNNRGYDFCGDWELATSKIPDMKEFTDRIHEIGMKVMLWYSVPFVGMQSKNYARFKDMLLDQTGNNKTYWSLDPRYKEAREFLIGIYKSAVEEWGLDGLKLDFIDAFTLSGKSLEYDPRRDYLSLEDGIDALMTEVKDALTAINPDVLIEFRQKYVGPAIRKYGNMLRSYDCPDDPLVNRTNTINLRLTSGSSAVHSDMLMWNYNEPVEAAALQFANVMYSVPQISVKIQNLNDEHKKMLEFYLRFWIEHRDVLASGKLYAANPEGCYSAVWATAGNRCIYTTYADGLIEAKNNGECVIINASRHPQLVLRGFDGKSYVVKNCMDEKLGEGVIEGNLFEVTVPVGGMIFTK